MTKEEPMNKYENACALIMTSCLSGINDPKMLASLQIIMDEVNRIENERNNVFGLLKRIVTAGAIDQHTKDYTWQQFKTDNNL